MSDTHLTGPSASELRTVLAHLVGRQTEALRLYRPLFQVEPFHASQTRRRLLIGGHRSSKTFSAAAEVARCFTNQDPHKKYPTTGRAILVGKDEPHLGEVFYKKLFDPGAFRVVKANGVWEAHRPDDPLHHGLQWRLSPPLIPRRLVKETVWIKKKARQPRLVRLHNGWEIHFFGSGSTPPRGWDVDLVWFDEEIVSRDWLPESLARLIDRKGYFIWSATPQAGTEQLHKLHQAARRSMGEANPDVEEWILDSYGNPYVLRSEVERYDRSLATDEERAVRLHGAFVFGMFRVYPEWDSRLLIDPFVIPKKWTRYVFIDPGRQVCAALFVAVPPPDDPQWGGRFVAYDELYLKQCDAQKFAAAMREKIGTDRIQAFVIDWHEARKRETGSGITISRQYSRALKEQRVRSIDTGCGFDRAPDDMEGGIESVHRWLMGGVNGEPTPLVVFKTLKYLYLEMEEYAYGRNTAGMPNDKPNKINDHLADCLRYAAMSEPKYVPRKSKRSRDTAAYDEFQEIFGRRRRGMNVGPMA